jgi:hypothetical protein
MRFTRRGRAGRDRLRLVRSRVVAATGLLLGVSSLVACVPFGIACPAIGYVYTAPVVVEISPELVGDGVVSACLGVDCEAAPFDASPSGPFEVPQEPPFAPTDTLGLAPGDSIRVLVTDDTGAVVRDVWQEVPYTTTLNGSCPGPTQFDAVIVK